MPGASKSKEVREAIIRLREQGYSHGQIAHELRHVGVTKQTSFYTCKKFAKTGTVDDLEKPGRPRSALLTFTDKTGTDIVPNQGFHGRGSQKCWLGSVLNDSLKNKASIGRFICNLSNQNIPN